MNTTRAKAGCVACDGLLRFYGRREEYEYHRCTRCGTIQLRPMPAPEELRLRYANEARATRLRDGKCGEVTA